MFEKIGRKLVRGAKAEMFEPPGEDGRDYILEIILAIGKIGIFALALLADSKGEKSSQQPSTVIVNNYIYKEEKE